MRENLIVGQIVESFSAAYGKITAILFDSVEVIFPSVLSGNIKCYFRTDDFIRTHTFNEQDNVWYDNFTRKWVEDGTLTKR